MFQFRPEQLASIRRKKIDDALIATHSDPAPSPEHHLEPVC
jgi:hypothetical protein